MTAEIGKTVKFNFVGTLSDGSQFDSTAGKGPVEVQLGTQTLMPALEQALLGMAAGDTKTTTVAAADAFGPRNEDLVLKIERAKIPSEIELTTGTKLTATGADGEAIQLTVVGFDDDSVTVDSNHPLAGHDLTFELELVEVI
jgi:peptidylprolyl isomerase